LRHLPGFAWIGRTDQEQEDEVGEEVDPPHDTPD